MRVALLGVLTSLVLTGCLGSTTTYRPYKGEPRPEQEVRGDPIRAEVELKHGIPHYVDEDTAYIGETKKGQAEVLDHVHNNSDGSRRNAWNAYATDMNGTLGAGTVKEAPKLQPKSEMMLKKSEETGEGGGEKKAAEGGDKGAEGGEKGGDKGMDKGGEKKE
jgi:hypothetical protein